MQDETFDKESFSMGESTLFKAEETSRSCADHVLDHAGGFYIAESFNMILCLERKRRERSERPMTLMLIDIMLIPGEKQGLTVKTISHLLTSLTRDTDIKGWYRENQIIGVLFTEFNAFDKQEILKKIRNGLERSLPPDQMLNINFSIHDFPDAGKQDPCDPQANSVLYPDVRKKYDEMRGPYLVKRVIDIVGSIVGLMLFSPFFLVIPVLIKLTSPGPVLFRQRRVGLYGKQFKFLKFRTMYMNNDSHVHEEYVKKLIAGTVGGDKKDDDCKEDDNGNGGRKPVFKITNDTRVTPVGRILRKTSMDELPQFINVLFGEMSLVGPRPPIPYEVQNYDVWHRCRIVEVKPGITGLWQVTGRSTTSFDEMVRLDIKYSREWTIWLDLKIIAMTPWAVFKGKGAY
jgi:lipopolysaccharide/colanic/teichoic acid biosynthesis glycosyltransferase